LQHLLLKLPDQPFVIELEQLLLLGRLRFRGVVPRLPSVVNSRTAAINTSGSQGFRMKRSAPIFRANASSWGPV
jgi:hypothetical protein